MIAMKEKKKIYPNPKFVSAEEEDKYWAGHSPIDEGYTGEVQVEKQKRSSFLTIRFTGDELTQLRDLAGRKGMGPSTYIRSIIKDLFDNEDLDVGKLKKIEQRLRLASYSVVKDKSIQGSYKSNTLPSALNERYRVSELINVPATREEIKKLIVESISSDTLDQLISRVINGIAISDKRGFGKTKRRVKSEKAKIEK